MAGAAAADARREVGDRVGWAVSVMETGRLVLRRLVLDDAPFVLELVNDPAWLQFIGDRGVRTLDDARTYIAEGPLAMYRRFGFGLYLVTLKDSRTPIGLCGLIKRDTLDDVDLGFAFLPAFREQGYACEAASAVVAHGRRDLDLERIVAITSTGNDRSERVLARVGLVFRKVVQLKGSSEPVKLFSTEG